MGLFSRDRLTQLQAKAPDASAHGVMIVDDEEGNLRVLRTMLADRFRVIEARDGREALDLLENLAAEDAPSVILSDQRMPRMTGIELFERIRDRLPASIRIIITGFVDVGAIVDAINRAGIYKFIVKPFDRNDLLLTLERAVEAFEMRREIERHIEQLEDKVRERTRELEQKHQALLLASAELERASLTDALTGLGNRRFVEREISERGRLEDDERRSGLGQRVAYLLVDVDHFKSVNDTYGHAAGDAVLIGLSEVLRQCCREGDLAARWGGEEFLLRIRVEDEAQAIGFARRLRESVASARFDIGDGQQLQRTCSIGIALHPFDPRDPQALSWEHVLSVADHALYLAKRGGRNAALCLTCGDPSASVNIHRIHEELQDWIDAGALRLLRES
ncbi:GGDEF domain-containing protein [Pseudomarimonas arenosa]|uniref:diguanylate cyclase n=1 Tax=Pseudomarimonas arenosa TaxID=2774145 RepID=A0AAW3ZP95_9GAMM|nr:diguanylate cyclase [Pseudomarimonas arenosa]MBD8526101.1 diguanylate cyclase [Pseudomarimonas arenosa]